MTSLPVVSARRPRLLINCTNLHVGGAVAVASSFVNTLRPQTESRLEISLLLSTSVHANLTSLGADLSGFANCEVINYYGLGSLWQGLGQRFATFDVIFTVFGPAYAIAKGRRHVCGFAQPLIIYPRNPVEQRMKLGARVLQRLKYIVQEFFFARADELVVELEHVKLALERKQLFRDMPIHIVYNTVDAVFKEPARWEPLSFPPASPALRVGVVSRNYAHKNLACLPALQHQLQQAHGLAVEFFVTFTEAEWLACDEDFRRVIHNVGALVLPQCPNFYAAMDGIIFPSLLECFSAVPLEAMIMRKPLFASDLPFIRDCCHEHAQYFDPLDVASMAQCIARYYQELPEAQQQDQLRRAEAFVQRYPSSAERGRAYLDITLAAAQRASA